MPVNLPLFLSVSKQFIGEIIASFYQSWQEITSDPLILETFSGYRIEIVYFPCQEYLPSHGTAEERELIDQKVLALQQKQAIHKVFHPGGPDQFTSPLFTVPQKGGSHRSLANLKGLNHFVEYQHFKMEGVPMLKNQLKSKEFLTKINLKDAYLTVPIWTLCGSLRAFPLGWAVHLGFLQNL